MLDDDGEKLHKEDTVKRTSWVACRLWEQRRGGYRKNEEIGKERGIYTARRETPLAFPVRIRGEKEGTPSSNITAQQVKKGERQGHEVSSNFCSVYVQDPPILVELPILKNIILYKVVPIKLTYRSAKARLPSLALSMVLSWRNRAERRNAGTPGQSESLPSIFSHSYFSLIPSSREQTSLAIFHSIFLMLLHTL